MNLYFHPLSGNSRRVLLVATHLDVPLERIGEALFAQNAPILDAHLAGRTWVAQDRPTLADFSLAAGLALAGPAKFPMADYPNIRAWLGRVQELDAWRKTSAPSPARA
jgi:glutathione S-transferase